MPRVLIIDDESGIRFALQRWFARQGWAVLEAPDGPAGLSLLRQACDDDPVARIDVVLCDLHLPGLSGDELHSTLLREHPEIIPRMIFSTGDPVVSARPGSIIATHPHVLQKPFELSLLRTLIDTIHPAA